MYKFYLTNTYPNIEIFLSLYSTDLFIYQHRGTSHMVREKNRNHSRDQKISRFILKSHCVGECICFCTYYYDDDFSASKEKKLSWHLYFSDSSYQCQNLSDIYHDGKSMWLLFSNNQISHIVINVIIGYRIV